MDPQIGVEVFPSLLTGWSGRPTVMGTAHQHDDLELNLVVEGGTMLYLIGGMPVEVGPGSVAAFWAAVPHQVVANSAARVHWVHIPFPEFLRWRLPDAVTSRLLSGVPLISASSTTLATDPVNFTQWAKDLADGQAEHRRIALLELEARVRRLALATIDEPMRRYTGGDPVLRQVVAMARHIAEHFREPLTVADIAAAARLHPNYAMGQFRKVLHTTVGDYLTSSRLAEARRLLITTDLPITRVAAESGFGSGSRFYAAFTSACGVPPARFRREHADAAGA
ncbi:helix-turn-helix domain-containing protein [Kitasatospora camelliae]|uniref:Helix-turn-helix domain-containing protein n=1 Tax=Kitasatospora camelliae TaxID=3156397 RepID=A0AAU8K441_9ACTN